MTPENLLSMAVQFDLANGLSPEVKTIRRNLSSMAGMYADEAERSRMAAEEDLLVYEYYDLKRPEEPGEIAFGTSITYPGKVGDEYFMTKGHYHTILETAEVYFCLRGRGYMLMESPEGAWEAQEFLPGVAVYIPPRYAHRSINVSDREPLVTFFSFRADAGHDYGIIETEGFRMLLVEREGTPAFVENPRRRG